MTCEVLIPETEGKNNVKGGEKYIMLLNKKLTTAIATGAILTYALSGVAFASSTGVIAGNGADSQNALNIHTEHSVTTEQNNNANVANNVSASSSTGGNSADFNTGGFNGGGSTIVTGNASNSVQVLNKLNSNKLDLMNCGCDNGGNTAIIDANGAFSANALGLKSKNNTDVFQTNDAYVSNNVDAKASTGKNSADFGTGGSNLILTGSASNAVGVATEANQNVAHIGGSKGPSDNGNAVVISANGALSDNAANLETQHKVLVDQLNNAEIANAVKSGAYTGKNSTDYTTNGNNQIMTGSANNLTEVQNLANSNWVDLQNCGCASGGDLYKIFGNGAFAADALNAKTKDSTALYGTNNANVANDVYGKAKTGKNSENFNTGSVFGVDPTTLTGNANSHTMVSNQLNSNVASDGMTFNWGNWEWSLGFSNPLAGM